MYRYKRLPLYIKFDQAIKYINNHENLILFTQARPRIFNECCKSLAEGKNVENVSRILEDLMQANSNYFDYTILHNLILLADGTFTSNLATKAQEILATKYKKLLASNDNLKLTIDKPTKNFLVGKPEALIKLLQPMIEKIALSMVTGGKELETKYSWNSGGTLNFDRFIEGKVPVEHLNAVNCISNNNFVMGSPNMRDTELAHFIYHEPTNKIIHLKDILRFRGKIGWLGDRSTKKELWSKYQIEATEADIDLLKLIYKRQFDLYCESLCYEEQHSYNYWNEIREIKNERHAAKIQDFEQEHDCNFSYIPEDIITKMFFEALLERCGKLQFCLNFSHISQVSTITITNKKDLERLMNYARQMMRDNPLICTFDGNNEHADSVSKFGAKQIKKLTKNNEANIIFLSNFITAFKEEITE